MKNLLGFTFLLLSLSTIGQYVTKDTSFLGWRAVISYDPSVTDSLTFNLIIHGAGEVSNNPLGTNDVVEYNKLKSFGPHFWRLQTPAYNMQVVLPNGTHKPVWITLQVPGAGSGYTRPWQLKPVIDAMLNRFPKVKNNSRHAYAFSRGVWVLGEFMTYKPTASDYSYHQYFQTLVDIQGQNPTDVYDATIPNGTGSILARFGHSAKLFDTKVLAFEQYLDSRLVYRMTENMNDSAGAGHGFQIYTNFGSGGHTNFNDFYNPSQNNWTLTNPDVQSSAGGRSTVAIPTGQNVYQWSMLQGDTSLADHNNPPVSNAGSNQTVTLPTTSVTLAGSGTDSDGSIASYLWTKVSGPATHSFGNAASPTSTFTGVQGVYVLNLKVTDNEGAIGNATVTIKINAAPISNAGSDQSVTLPADSVQVNGSGSDADGTITSYQWQKIAGPSTYTIVSPASAVTKIRNLVEGTYQFTLTVTDNNGATDKDTVQVTVNPSVVSSGSDTINVNVYGGTNPYTNTAWNNWNIGAGTVYNVTSPLFTYSNGTSSDVTATLSFSQSVGDNGSGYGGTMCPPQVLRYSSYTTSNRTITLNNLNPAATYDLEFYSSRNNTGPNNTIFTINGVSDTVLTDNNLTTAAVFTGIQPDGSNNIVISLARYSGFYQYINGFRVIESTEGGEFAELSTNGLQTTGITSDLPVGAFELKISPNPANSLLNIRYSGAETGKMQIAIYDATGRLVDQKLFNKKVPMLQEEVNISAMKKGLYFINMKMEGGKSITQKFIKR